MFFAADPETVVVVRPTGKDNYGDPLPGAGAETELDGCLLAPAGSAELLEHANQVTVDAQLFTPPGADITATDRIRARGVTYEVVGEPQRWGRYGIALALRRVAG